MSWRRFRRLAQYKGKELLGKAQDLGKQAWNEGSRRLDDLLDSMDAGGNPTQTLVEEPQPGAKAKTSEPIVKPTRDPATKEVVLNFLKENKLQDAYNAVPENNHELRGFFQYAFGNMEESVNESKQAVSITQPTCRIAYAHALAHSDSEFDISSVLGRLEKKSLAGVKLAGVVNYNTGDFDKARQRFGILTGLEPGNSDHTLNKLRAYNKLGQLGMAQGLIDAYQMGGGRDLASKLDCDKLDLPDYSVGVQELYIAASLLL